MEEAEPGYAAFSGSSPGLNACGAGEDDRTTAGIATTRREVEAAISGLVRWLLRG